MNHYRVISGTIGYNYYHTNHTSSMHSMMVMIEQSKLCDSNRIFELFIYFEDSIMFEGCYLCNTPINFYIKIEQFVNGNGKVTRLTDCNFACYNRRRTFYVSNIICESVQLTNIISNNIIIQDSGNNNDISYNDVYFDISKYELGFCDYQNVDRHWIRCDNLFKLSNNSYFYDHYVIASSSTTSSLTTCAKERISCMLHHGSHLLTIRNRYDINFDMTSDCFIGDNNNTLTGYSDNNKIDKFILNNYDVDDNYENCDCCVAQPNEGNNKYCVFIQNEIAQWPNFSYDIESIAVCDIPYHNGEQFIEKPLSYITLHACSNSHHILFLKLTDTIDIINQDSSSNYIIVNSHESLLLTGEWKTYVLNNTSLLVLENKITDISFGFECCIDRLIATINGKNFVLNDTIEHHIMLNNNIISIIITLIFSKLSLLNNVRI